MKKLLILIALFFAVGAQAQNATELIKKSEELLRGAESSSSKIKMTIQRPKYSRELVISSWVKTEKYALIYLEAPVRDKGTVFLKKDKEIWNWVPSIERVIKLPPSMMMQSWMGSDFTNDDLVKSSSVINDYKQEVVGTETINEIECYKIQLIPNPEAPVVWGKVFIWIGTENYVQMKVEYFDEDDYLINTLSVLELGTFEGRTLPAKIELIPNDEPENKTTIDYLDFKFDIDIKEDFFTVQSMKRLRL